MMKTVQLTIAVVAVTLLSAGARAQNNSEGMVPTQALVAVDAKSQAPGGTSDLRVEVDGRKVPLNSWTAVVPAQAQVALLIDDGLRESVGRNLDSIRGFVTSLPPSVEVLVGYMQNGRVASSRGFTSDHAAAAAELRLPSGVPGQSASPYFCLSDFVKHWPAAGSVQASPEGAINRGGASGPGKARFVLMVTNGVDLYNGSPSVMNQNSPYVDTAITDSQRAGVAVYSIYFGGAGIRGGSAAFSGQSYLQQVADATGGQVYTQGLGNPVDMTPFFKQFTSTMAKTYIAGFEAPRKGRELVRLKVSSASKAKLRAPQAVEPGNVE